MNIGFTEYDYSVESPKNGITLFLSDQVSLKLGSLAELDSMIDQLVMIRLTIKDDTQ